MRTWWKLALLVVAAVVATQLLVRPGPQPVPGGTPAPPLVLPDLAGRPVDLAALRGKVVAVNFWASWCGPCLAEMPELAEVWRRNRGRCFELLGVAEESAREDVREVSGAMPYPILVDARAEAKDAWQVVGYPSTYLVDAQGRLVKLFRGAVRGRDLEEAVSSLLPASCPGG
ncbi:MAG TPA: TlpA disulfide reductase family protein [Anaeromyxobacteraceae bacterium]|nr:TlpA disulfide reductase family protein [Anaeromyxobacteraceae bacterium]